MIYAGSSQLTRFTSLEDFEIASVISPNSRNLWLLFFIQSIAIPVDRHLAHSKQVPTSVYQNTQTVICTSRLYYYSILVAIYPRHTSQRNFTLHYVCCCFPK